MSKWIHFNIHSLVTMRVDRNTPTASLLEHIFDPFITTEDPGHYDITVMKEHLPLVDGAFGEVHGSTEFHYSTRGINLEALDVQITFDGDEIRLSGDSELLVMVLPLIDHLMVKKNAAMIHALTVAYKGKGICMPAWGGTGKTSTMSKLVKMDDFAFMGDDWAFVTEDSRLLGYAKPMSIKPYHRSLYPHIFAESRKPLVPVRFAKPISRMTTIVHPYVTKYPQLARLTRRWSPEHITVMPRKVFPNHEFAHNVPIVAGLFAERVESDRDEPHYEEKSPEWMVSQLIGNFFSEMPKQSRTVLTSLGAAGLVPIDQFFKKKSEILNKAFKGKPVFWLRIPKKLSPDRASAIIVEKIQDVLAHVSVS